MPQLTLLKIAANANIGAISAALWPTDPTAAEAWVDASPSGTAPATARIAGVWGLVPDVPEVTQVVTTETGLAAGLQALGVKLIRDDS